MNYITKLGTLITLLFITQLSMGQSSDLREFHDQIKKSMTESGYKLIEDGVGPVGNGTMMRTDKRNIIKGAEYVFVGLAANCSECDMFIKFGRHGENSNDLPKRKTSKQRSKELGITMFSNRAVFESNGEGYFMLMTNSSIERPTVRRIVCCL